MRREYDDEEDGDTILADDLSMCDEEGNGSGNQNNITSSEARLVRRSSRQYKHFAYFLLASSLLISALVATVRHFGHSRLFADTGRSSGGGSWWDNIWDSGRRERENGERIRLAVDFLTRHGVVENVGRLSPYPVGEIYGGQSGEDAVTGEEEDGSNLIYTAEYTTVLWIAALDSLRIAIPGEYASYEDGYAFVQRYVLALFFVGTGGFDRWLYKLNFLNGHECNWWSSFNGGVLALGLGCDDDGDPDGEGRTVTDLIMPSLNRLTGTLPSELRHLRHLKRIFIHKNKGLRGTIPTELGELSELRMIALMDNALTGTIPQEFSSLERLERVLLDSNGLTGDTAEGALDWIEGKANLIHLSVGFNNIIGTLPESIGGLTSLELLSLSDNGLHGPLPTSIGALKSLKFLALDDNSLTGDLAVLGKLSNLTQLYLESNPFGESNATVVTETFLSGLERLRHVDLSNCSLSGRVPSHLIGTNYAELEVLDLSLNSLEGELVLPSKDEYAAAWNESGFGSTLSYLSLGSNHIGGTIPTEIGLFGNLTVLDLSRNSFVSAANSTKGGGIPSELGDLLSLEVLFLGENNFDEWYLPDFFQDMSKLTELSLRSSSLVWVVPHWIGELTGLQLLDLGDNDLTGTVPSEIGDLSNLVVLFLDGNRFKGDIDSAGFQGLPSIDVLRVQNNEFTGDAIEVCRRGMSRFVSDCGSAPGKSDGEVMCRCCTACCLDDEDKDAACGELGMDVTFNGMWEYGYSRVSWEFDDGPVAPP